MVLDSGIGYSSRETEVKITPTGGGVNLNENGIRIGYERLFNMGNFEHEKYTISKDVEADSEFDAWKKLALQIAEFEDDLKNYRSLRTDALNIKVELSWQTNGQKRELLNKQLAGIERALIAFEMKHHPVHKPCKCFYCIHPEWASYDEDDYPDEDE
jgi:hypothetical protein